MTIVFLNAKLYEWPENWIVLQNNIFDASHKHSEENLNNGVSYDTALEAITSI